MRTPGVRIGLAAAVLFAASCHNTPPVAEEPPYSVYHAPGLEWCRVNRVLVVPFDNESTVSMATEQVRRAFVAELQQVGRFEVVPAPPDVWATLSGQIRSNGVFNEAVLIELARCTRADLIVLGTISQYTPYRLPRLGLVLQVISPADATVVASVDGLWDSTHQDIAGRARAYYREDARGGRTAPFPETLALESPQYFQRFVCHEAVAALLSVPDLSLFGQQFADGANGGPAGAAGGRPCGPGCDKAGCAPKAATQQAATSPAAPHAAAPKEAAPPTGSPKAVEAKPYAPMPSAPPQEMPRADAPKAEAHPPEAHTPEAVKPEPSKADAPAAEPKLDDAGPDIKAGPGKS